MARTRRKAFFAALMVTVLTVGTTLAGCGASQPAASETKTLRVVTSADNPPKEFIVVDNGKSKVVGFDIDLAKYVAKKIGYKFDLTNMKFDGILPAMQAGQYDMAIAGFNPTPERKKAVDFSIPYYHQSFAILTLKGNVDKYSSIESLKGKNVAVQKGSTQEKILAGQLPESHAVSLGDLSEVVTEVVKGTSDAALVSGEIAKNYMKNYPTLGIAKIDLKVPDAIAANVIVFPKNSSDLTAKVNKAIKEALADGSMDSFIAKNTELANKQG